jgi:hypothetical protein
VCCPVFEHEVNIFALWSFDMNVKHMLIGAAIFAAATSAFAQTNNRPGTDPPYSGGSTDVATPKTRAQVRAEVERAYREGTLHPIGEEWEYPYLPPPQSTRSRADVRAEVERAYREGTLHPVGEEWAYPFLYPCRPQRAFAC